jgi:uncharacterized protein YndB with AHSA1/START domain
MTNDVSAAGRIIGSLRSADGTGVVRLEDRFDTSADDLWDALTDPRRLARWLGVFEGDLRLGGEIRTHFYASGCEDTERIEVCEPPRRLVLQTIGVDGSAADVMEVTLTADGSRTVLVLEHRGLPLDELAGYGAGDQIHVEDLAAHIAGGERCDARARFGELYPVYQDLAAAID